MNENNIPSACSIPLTYDEKLIRGREGEFVRNSRGLVVFDAAALTKEANMYGYITVTVHDGSFHCDELVMITLFEFVTGLKALVTRSRTNITSCVNGDTGRGEFDHHGNLLDDGVRCAASKMYTALYQTPEYRIKFPEEWWTAVGEIVDQVARQDNTGILNGLFPFVSTLSRNTMITRRDNFEKALDMMRVTLTAEFENILAEVQQRFDIEPIIEAQKNEAVIVFDRATSAVDVKKIFWEKELPVIFMVTPSGMMWSVLVTPAQTEEYQKSSAKKKFNPQYCGLDAEALAAATGLPDAQYCHAKGFAAKFGSLESAIKFAQMNLE